MTTAVEAADTMLFGLAYLRNFGTQNLAGTYAPKEIATGLSGVGAVLLKEIAEADGVPPLEALAALRDVIVPGIALGPEQTDRLLYGIAVLDAALRGSDEDLDALFKDGPATIAGLIDVTMQLAALLAIREGLDMDEVLDSFRDGLLGHVAGLD